jgi:hypothetical protein
MTPDEEKIESEKTELAAKKTKEVEPEKVKTPEEIAADEAAKLEADKKDAEKKAAQKVEHIVLSTDEKTNFILFNLPSTCRILRVKSYNG